MNMYQLKFCFLIVLIDNFPAIIRLIRRKTPHITSKNFDLYSANIKTTQFRKAHEENINILN